MGTGGDPSVWGPTPASLMPREPKREALVARRGVGDQDLPEAPLLRWVVSSRPDPSLSKAGGGRGELWGQTALGRTLWRHLLPAL